MSWLLIGALIVKAFITGTAIGVWLERRAQHREELARRMYRPRLSTSHGAE